MLNSLLGWRGALLEASSLSFRNLVRNRANELRTAHNVICNDDGRTMHYIVVKNFAAKQMTGHAMSGVKELMPAWMCQRFELKARSQWKVDYDL